MPTSRSPVDAYQLHGGPVLRPAAQPEGDAVRWALDARHQRAGRLRQWYRTVQARAAILVRRRPVVAMPIDAMAATDPPRGDAAIPRPV